MAQLNGILLNELTRLLKHYDTNKDTFRARALRPVVKALEEYPEKIISADQAKKNIKGIGKGIEARIDEILKTGRLKELEGIVNDDEALNVIMSVTGIGPVKAKKLVKQGIKTIDQLRRAFDNKEVDLTHHTQVGLKWHEDIQQRIPRNEVALFETRIKQECAKIDPNILMEICGSYRRGCDTCGDIDVLISIQHPQSKTAYLKKLVMGLKKVGVLVDDLTDKGDKKYMGVGKIDKLGRRIDIRYMEYENFFAGLVYFTGSKNFNIQIRQRALEMGYSLNEYSFTRVCDDTHVIVHSEKELFDILEMEYVQPNDRNI